MVMPQDLGDNVILEDRVARVGREHVNRLARHALSQGDIVFSRRGDVGRRALVRQTNSGWLCGTGCLRIRLGIDGPHDAAFVSYALGQPSVQDWIVQHAVGATMLNLNTQILGSVPLLMPGYWKQRAIADVLGALDDKIASNRSVRLAAARLRAALFVETQSSGTVQPLRAILNLHYGRALPEATRRPGDVAVVGSGGLIGGHDEKLIDGPCVVIGRKGSIGTTHWIPGDAYPIDTTFFVEPNPGIPLSYAYEVLLGADFSAMNYDSAVPGLNRDQALSMNVPVADSASMREFEDRADLLHELVSAMVAESRTLEKLRDALLPKLMSGELRVRDAEKLVEDVV
ncbi:MAG: hypothetical protein V9F00_06190 [Nocardioides sp.]